jgi:hypothetical protein
LVVGVWGVGGPGKVGRGKEGLISGGRRAGACDRALRWKGRVTGDSHDSGKERLRGRGDGGP